MRWSSYNSSQLAAPATIGHRNTSMDTNTNTNTSIDTNTNTKSNRIAEANIGRYTFSRHLSFIDAISFTSEA